MTWNKASKLEKILRKILAYTPGSYHVEQIVRPRRVEKGNEDAGVKQANIPPRLIPKGMVDESVVASFDYREDPVSHPYPSLSQEIETSRDYIYI